jgi:hypothetical protein
VDNSAKTVQQTVQKSPRSVAYQDGVSGAQNKLSVSQDRVFKDSLICGSLTASTPPPDEADDLSEHFLERGAILEFDANLPHDQAEIEAARMTSTLARNRGYRWASLKAALPVHLAKDLPEEGIVDRLPFGYAKHAITPPGSGAPRIQRQGAYSTANEVFPSFGSQKPEARFDF